MLGKGYIRPSTSPYIALVLIVKKLDRGLYIYIDYRSLNALTVKNYNTLLLIRETLARLYTIKVYTKFDIIAVFNEIRIKVEEEEKTIFLIRYGLFEYIVILFGLCNALSTFQAFINKVLREYLDIFYLVYLDNILIYSSNEKEYIKHVRKVLCRL